MSFYGKRPWLTDLPAYKLRPAPDGLPGRWMTGTQSHEGIAGTAAAVAYLADLGRTVALDAADRRSVLRAAYAAIAAYERELADHLLRGLRALSAVRRRRKHQPLNPY